MGSIFSRLTSVAAVALLSTGLVAALVAATGLTAQPNPSEPPAAARHEGDPPAQNKAEAQGESLPAGARLRLGTLDWRHGGGVAFVAFTPDGKSILTGSLDIRLWDRKTGKELRRFRSPPAPDDLPQMALSKDGKLLAAANLSRGIVVWELETGKELRHIAGAGNGNGILEFTPDGKLLVFRGWNGWIRCFETASGKEFKPIQGPRQGGGMPGYNPASAGMAISADGKTVATAQTDEGMYVNLHDLETGKLTQQIEEMAPVTAVAYSPDGKYLAYATGPAIVLRDAKTTKEIRKIKTPINVSALAFSPNSQFLAAKAGDWLIHIWETETGKEIQALGEGIRGDISGFMQPPLMRTFGFSPDSKFVAASAGHSVRIWEIATAKEQALGGGHRAAITDLMVAADGKTVVSRGGDKVLRWDAATGKELGGFPVPLGTASTALTQDGRLAALVMGGNTIRLVDVATGKQLRQVQGPGPYAGAVAFSPSGKVLASRGRGAIWLHDALEGSPFQKIALPAEKERPPWDGKGRMPDHPIPDPMVLAFSPDGLTLAAPAADTLRLWDVTTGKEIGKCDLPQPTTGCMAFAPDGRVLAVENVDHTISLWETATGKERSRLGNAQAPDTHRPLLPTATLVFSPDGGLLATKAGAEIVIWDVTAAKEIGRFKGQEEITALAFFPNGKALVSGSFDTTSLIWETADLKRAPARPAAELQPKELELLWADLADEDAARAFRSILTLASASKSTVPYLRDRLQPAAPVDPKMIKKLIADLDSDDFKTRNKASKELESLGEVAVPALRAVLASKVSLETRQRVEPILAKLAGKVLSADQVRVIRAVEVLERLATPEARQVLQTLAEGAPGALPTRHARAALGRLPR
jgi:WD40 repeat protein